MKRLTRVLILFTTFGLIVAPSRAQEELTSQDCLDCHSDEELTKEGSDGEIISLSVDGEIFGQTIIVVTTVASKGEPSFWNVITCQQIFTPPCGTFP